MKPGTVARDFRILKEGDMYGDTARVSYCRECGFVELYKDASTKESWRWRTYPVESEPVPTREEAEKPKREEPERKPVKRLVR
jgi:hypothetical protein